MNGPYRIHQSSKALILELELVVREKEAFSPVTAIGIDGRFKTMARIIVRQAGFKIEDWNCVDILAHNQYSFRSADDSYYNFYRKRYTFSYEPSASNQGVDEAEYK